MNLRRTKRMLSSSTAIALVMVLFDAEVQRKILERKMVLANMRGENEGELRHPGRHHLPGTGVVLSPVVYRERNGEKERYFVVVCSDEDGEMNNILIDLPEAGGEP